QCHYLGCLREVARRVQEQTHVMGFDSLNEPSRGWIGLDINDNRTADKAERMPGPAIAPIDGLLMAQGRTVTVPEVKLSYLRLGLVPSGTRVLNANRVTIWHSPERDPFLQRGAYSLEANGAYRVHMPDLFQKKSDGSPLDFDSDCMRVLFERVARVMRMHNKDWMLFAEKEPHATLLNPELPPAPEQTVNAGHWYDVTVLFLKKFPYPFGFDGISGKPALGANGIRKSYIRQLSAFQQASVKQQQPALLGEFGIPFDLDNGRAYKAAAHKQKDGRAWRKHSRALGLMYDAIDHHLLHSTLWNYTASNRNDARIGDGWNQEDLSIYSADQKHGVFGSNAGVSFHPDNGGRALSGFVRPYVRRAQGTLLSMQYNSKKRTFEAEIAVRTNTDGHPTEIFVPAQVYKNSYRYQVWLPVGYAYTAVCRSLSLQPHDVEALLLIYVTTDGKHGAATTDTDDAIDADDQHATDRRMQILIRPEK
ncbi:MAG: hypothetical protein KDK30_12760, partial [Leptospiraceae bacterium]|nr:hypothetical protein [Leptospiraceae bacterium]